MKPSDKPLYGCDYTDLLKLGWFNNRRVAEAFDVDFDQGRIARTFAIKQAIYSAAGTDSLAKIPPRLFLQLANEKGIATTVPSSLKQAAGL